MRISDTQDFVTLICPKTDYYQNCTEKKFSMEILSYHNKSITKIITLEKDRRNISKICAVSLFLCMVQFA